VKFWPERTSIESSSVVVTVQYFIENESERETTGVAAYNGAAESRCSFPQDQLLLFHRSDAEGGRSGK
jgi:hypothetical protein